MCPSDRKVTDTAGYLFRGLSSHPPQSHFQDSEKIQKSACRNCLLAQTPPGKHTLRLHQVSHEPSQLQAVFRAKGYTVD